MGTYFHGWRRKLGCVALAIAIPFAVSWIRSYVYHEGFSFSVSGRKHSITTWNGDLIWMAFKSTGSLGPSFWSHAIVPGPPLRDARPLDSSRWVMPHFAIVTPLTVLSASLLLSIGTFFHGRRRKVGGITFVLAVIVSAGWIRSFTASDEFTFSTSAARWHIVTSELGNLRWVSSQCGEWRPPSWDAFPIEEMDVPDEHASNGWFIRYNEPTNADNFEIIAPYWLAVGPLTLLSALLIVWPKKKTPKQTPSTVVNATEPDPECVQNMLLECPQVTR
jgi:hypothetical protein